MEDRNLLERIIHSANDVLDDALEEYVTGPEANAGDITRILETLREELLVTLDTPLKDKATISFTAAQENLRAQMRTELEEKRTQVGDELFNAIIRFEYLRTIDQRWLNHLENLDELREAVYLRSYAQKNPLLEYKLEGFKAFDVMLQEIRTVVAKKLFAVRAEGMEVRTPGTPVAGAIQTRHSDMQLIGGNAAAASEQRAARNSQPPAGGRVVQVRRATPKVGRNDPCPCGSGKKYKHCCGRNE